MKIELKNLKIALHMSEETTAFTADLYVKGMRVGYAKNDGHGGCTFYHHDPEPECRMLLKRAEEFCLSLPPIVLDGVHSGGKPFSIPMNLEHFIDELVQEELIKKDKKKLEKKMVNHIMWGPKKFSGNYTQIKLPKPLTAYTKEAIQKAIDTYKKELKPNEEFYNTNLKVLGIKL